MGMGVPADLYWLPIIFGKCLTPPYRATILNNLATSQDVTTA